MSADDRMAQAGMDVDGPGREALDCLHRFVAAIELTPTVAVHAIDRDGTVRFWNKACGVLFGVDAHEALGRALRQIVSHLEREDEFSAALDAVWRTGRPAPARDWRVLLADGRQRWIYSTMFALKRDGAPYQLVSMDIDVSARKLEEAALAHAGGNFRELFERSLDAIVLIRGKVIVEVNPAALRLFRCEHTSEMVGKSLLDFSPARQPCGRSSAQVDADIAAQAFRDGNRRYEWRYQLPDGSAFCADVLQTSVTHGAAFVSYAVIRDLTAHKAAEHALRLAARVFAHCRDAIEIMDEAFRVVSVNQAFTDITGFSPDDIVGRAVQNFRAGAQDPAFYQKIWDDVAAHGHWQGELWCVRKNGESYPARLALTAMRDEHGKLVSYMAILSDITERRRSEERTRHLAEHDFLTDLPNRVLLRDRLQQALAAARRQHSKVAVLFLDLDRFKAINDTYGHHVGDLLLKDVAARLTRCVRGVDTVSRQGGDEFVVILADIGGEDHAAHVAGSVMQAIAQVTKVGGKAVSIGTSIGISIYPGDGADVETLLKHADVAMYHAKQKGRNGFSFFSPAMNAQVGERIALENTLRHALANDEFVLEYQPEVDIDSGLSVGLEALIRWRHPERGLLLPEQFIGVAEECGLIVPIGEWVLRQACARARAWRDQGYPVVVAVNLSSVQLFHSNLAQCVDEALRRAGLAPHQLDLEISERVFNHGDAAALATVERLRARGVQITVDNFGTGHASLRCLRRFPLSKLKIDRAFIDDGAIVGAIVAAARSLKLRVTAEGVETQAQLRLLRQYGCDGYQGHYAGLASAEPDLTRLHSGQA